MFRLLYLLSVSYWYCLPVVSTTVFGYTEFRAYDFLLLGLVSVLIGSHWQKVQTQCRSHEASRWLIRFCSWASAMALVSVVRYALRSNLTMVGVVAMSLWHLWGFALAYVAFRMFTKTGAQCLRLLDAFLMVGLIEALVICLQGVRILPIFWSDRYAIYGDRVFSGTLGMNRILPGHAMILVFAVGFAYVYNRRVVGARRMIHGLSAAAVSAVAILLSGSRTTWLAFAVFLGGIMLKRKALGTAVPTIIGLSLFLMIVMPDAVVNQVQDMYDYRVTTKLAQTPDEGSVVSKFEQVDAGRLKTWMQGFLTLAVKPWIIPLGLGFLSYGEVNTKGSGHNMILTLLVELGLVGLYLYGMWMRSHWRDSGRRERAPSNGSPDLVVSFSPMVVRPLLLSMFTSLMAGEILYVYRPCFAFLGMFLFLVAVLQHPALNRPLRAREPVSNGRGRRIHGCMQRQPLKAKPLPARWGDKLQ